MNIVCRLSLLLLPLALTSCFIAPGAFTAALDLKRSGDFTFAYKGEIVFQSPEDFDGAGSGGGKAWSDAMAVCPKDGAPSIDEDRTALPKAEDDADRPCTKAEIATLRDEWTAKQKDKAAEEAKKAAQFAAVFGFNPRDEEANRKLAATMMRYDGWKSVTYKGAGVFDVDYETRGHIGQDFVFPLMPQGDVLIPFVTLRGQDKGSVRIAAPALIGGALNAFAAQMKALGGPDGKGSPPPSRTHGTFTVTTEGEILTNNTADGPSGAAGARRLVWEIDPQTQKAPEALIKLR